MVKTLIFILMVSIASITTIGLQHVNAQTPYEKSVEKCGDPNEVGISESVKSERLDCTLNDFLKFYNSNNNVGNDQVTDESQLDNSNTPSSLYLTINLVNGELSGAVKKSMGYDLGESFTNIAQLTGMTFLNDTFDKIYVSGDSFNGQFTVLLPDSQDPSIVHSEDVIIYQDVKTIKTNTNGFKTYTGEAQTWDNTIAGIPFTHGELIETGFNSAMMVLYTPT